MQKDKASSFLLQIKKEEKMNFLKKKFTEYYSKADIEFPPRFDRREYAFIFFGEGGMHRHISFLSRDALISYLKKNSPAHSYYSSAYYRHPDAATMREKEWMGADLIFDLDADHIPDAIKLPYEKMLVMVKKEMEKLLSFLMDDFGFDKKDMRIYFSGGRGYHCHVSHPDVISLGSQERREIVDYVTARGLNIKGIVKEKSIPKEYFADKTIEIDPRKGGWSGRMARGIIDFLKEIKNMEKEKAIKKLMELEGIGEKTASSLYASLSDERIKRIEDGKIDQSREFKRIAIPLIKKLSVSLHSSADEPVTGDIKRLIRLPGSLHGKTGLRVTKVEINELQEFNPLRDAVVFGEEKVRVMIKKPFSIEMMENRFRVNEGVNEVPEYLAVFLMARGLATI